MGTFFEALVGYLTPISTTGRLLLEQELRECGVDTNKIPTACLQELTDVIVAHAKERAARLGENWKSVSVESIELSAGVIAGVLSGQIKEDNDTFEPGLIIETLRKHGVEVPT